MAAVNHDMSLSRQYDVFKAILTSVLTDEGFKISESGHKAQLCASKLLEWMSESSDNKEEMLVFSSELIKQLHNFSSHSLTQSHLSALQSNQ